MSVTSVTWRWSGKGGGDDRQPNSVLTNQQAVRIADVLTDNTADDESVVLIGPGIPVPGEAHPTRQWLRVARRRANQLEPNRWEVTIEYESIAGGQGNDNPIDTAPDIDWGALPREEEVDEDFEGKPISTCLGEPLEPRLRQNMPDLLLTITRNIPDFDPSVIVKYLRKGGAVSSDEFLNQPAGTVRMHDIRARTIKGPDFTYYNATAQIRFRRGWADVPDEKAFFRRVRAQGFFVRVPLLFTNPVQYRTVRATDEFGNPTSQPVCHYIKDTTVTVNGQSATKKAGEQIVADINDPWPLAQFYMFQDFDTLPFNVLRFFS